MATKDVSKTSNGVKMATKGVTKTNKGVTKATKGVTKITKGNKTKVIKDIPRQPGCQLNYQGCHIYQGCHNICQGCNKKTSKSTKNTTRFVPKAKGVKMAKRDVEYRAIYII